MVTILLKSNLLKLLRTDKKMKVSKLPSKLIKNLEKKMVISKDFLLINGSNAAKK